MKKQCEASLLTPHCFLHSILLLLFGHHRASLPAAAIHSNAREAVCVRWTEGRAPHDIRFGCSGA
ncbi:hypothetical protein [Paenibacillus solanacearum]|uniref:hypothetical protein n=1 Tax=Paenibacillus solanacearum TaxID=2048548 RepID=UPI001C408019|nr:hypothetical protein [Paenibacillus solanacearum]